MAILENKIICREPFETAGRLNIAAYDLDGSVLAVELIDIYNNKYLIADTKKGEALLRLAGQGVFIKGSLFVDCEMQLLEVDEFSLQLHPPRAKLGL